MNFKDFASIVIKNVMKQFDDADNVHFVFSVRTDPSPSILVTIDKGDNTPEFTYVIDKPSVIIFDKGGEEKAIEVGAQVGRLFKDEMKHLALQT